MSWVNAWQRADAVNATNEIIGPDGSLEEYSRVIEILRNAFGTESDGSRAREEYWEEMVNRDVLEEIHQSGARNVTMEYEPISEVKPEGKF